MAPPKTHISPESNTNRQTNKIIYEGDIVPQLKPNMILETFNRYNTTLIPYPSLSDEERQVYWVVDVEAILVCTYKPNQTPTMRLETCGSPLGIAYLEGKLKNICEENIKR